MRDDRPVLCCPDKFRGSLRADEAAAAFARGVERTGRPARMLPLADGGEGTLAVLCPDPADVRVARVIGPLGEPVDASWGLRDGNAVVESAQASGLALVDGVNDPLAATTRGTGELIRLAVDAGARRVIVAVGGTATVDGGLGALEALEFHLRGTQVLVACDVETTFVDAARVFGPQKGADALGHGDGGRGGRDPAALRRAAVLDPRPAPRDPLRRGARAVLVLDGRRGETRPRHAPCPRSRAAAGGARRRARAAARAEGRGDGSLNPTCPPGR